MLLVRSTPAPSTPSEELAVHDSHLARWVADFANPRNQHAQPQENRRVGDSIARLLRGFGYHVRFQGSFRNVVALPPNPGPGPLTFVGAHYDSVPESPGADDNASGLAVLLACAFSLSRAPFRYPAGFIAFNAEEDGLRGSIDLVRHLGQRPEFNVRRIHVLESVGFASSRKGSQRVPHGLPAPLPRVGNFIGLLANRDSNALLDHAVTTIAAASPRLPVVGLKTYLGIDRYLPVLHRSDHAPFWKAGIPALLWTDTAEFRNPNYHRASDLPDTLDYEFMSQVAAALTACVSTD